MPEIRVTPLGAGQDVGRSCILVSIAGKNVMLDCGMHMGFSDDRRFPDFSYITQSGRLTDFLDCVIIRWTMSWKSRPTMRVMCWGQLCSRSKWGQSRWSTRSVKGLGRGYLGVWRYPPHCHHLSQGDYNMTPDRHLGAAWIDKCRPNLLITESTYATTIRDSKRCRERDFLKKVHETVERGGKVLIPVFALGRAQELCILLETFWERMNLKVPIYFSTGLTEKANHYYKLFITWTNQKIRKTFVQRNMFEFKHIKAFDRAFADNPGPMVVFATPGMLHAGQSLQIFRKWAGNEKNMVIMPGYCVQGTVGHKILSGQRKLEMEGRQVLEVKMQVEYMSFSAHADAKGIMQLVGQAEPQSVLLVHGEAKKMEFLKQKIEQEFRVSCYMPANGETVALPTSPSIPGGISLGLLKREMAQGLLPEAKRPRLLHGTLIMKDSNFRLVSSEQALKELGLAEHQLRFTCRVHLHDSRKEQETAMRVYSHLKSVLKDHCVQHLPDGSVTVESILIQAAAPSEDPATKVLLVSWTYQDEELGSYLTSLLKKGLP
ncbi:integrator complex subunit 11 isoform X3 [Nycticebus coucang]|uniref:integrator complex subunit 11 isoform X3 n=1 Tax=Nycticebus coucang TaxID=9470 RepID=UPI00234C5EE8|nr:integrator complex subunit 11 isoform X3 [Nycticebus coucang]